MPQDLGATNPLEPTPGVPLGGATPCPDPYAGLEADAAAALAHWFTLEHQRRETGSPPPLGASVASPEGSASRTLASLHIGLTGTQPAGRDRPPVPTDDVDNWAVSEKSFGGHLEVVALYDPDGELSRRHRPPSQVKKKRDVEPWQLEELRVRAARRSRAALMWKVRCLKADNLFTLTKRDRIPTWDEAWRLWKLFEQMCSRRFRKFDYVVTIEPHQIDGWHIHFCVRGYFHLNTMRLFWHRVLLGQPRMLEFLRGDMSPGNVKMSERCGGQKKIGKYLAKYLSKTFSELRGEGRVKRFASSKGIETPTLKRSWMPSCAGGEVFFLRRRIEAMGYKITGMFESCVRGNVPMIWIQAESRAPP